MCSGWEVVCFRLLAQICYTPCHSVLHDHVKPNTHRRRRRDSTVELSRVGVGGVYWALQRLASDLQKQIKQKIKQKLTEQHIPSVRDSKSGQLFSKLGFRVLAQSNPDFGFEYCKRIARPQVQSILRSSYRTQVIQNHLTLFDISRMISY